MELTIKHGQISKSEAVSFITIAMINNIMFNSRFYGGIFSQHTAWLSTFITFGVAIVMLYLYNDCIKRSGCEELTGAMKVALGKVGGYTLITLVTLIILYNGAVQMSSFIMVVRTYVFNKTQANIIGIILMIGIIPMLFMGLETLTRLSRLLAATLAVLVIALIIMSADNYELNRVAPIFGEGVGAVAWTGVRVLPSSACLLGIFFWGDALKAPNDLHRVGRRGLIIACTAVIVMQLAAAASFSYKFLPSITVPEVQMASNIDLGIFFKRVDTVFILLWISGAIIAVCASVYTASLSFARTFQLTKLKPVILPMSILLLGFGIMFYVQPNISESIFTFVSTYAWALMLVIPVIGIVGLRVRNGKRTKEAGS